MITSIHYKSAGITEESRFEKLHTVIVGQSIDASQLVAAEIADLIRQKEKERKKCVLGLATGSSPIKVYEELITLHKKEGLSFKNVVTFNLDEYYSIRKENANSYHQFMNEHLFSFIDILPENIHIPDGTVAQKDIQKHCASYEEKIASYGSLDLQILEIGRTGHIGFNEHGLSDLLAEYGTSYELNLEIFKMMLKTISGWPGGKPNTDDTYRPERANPAKKRVIIFSPHLDDDVISMGGTFLRLVEQGHEVHVAYQTSGNIAVSDEEAIKFLEVSQELLTKFGDTKQVASYQKILKKIQEKKEGELDSAEVRIIKGLIRRYESLAATRYVGTKDENIHYQIYAAGDLADPHKVCLDIIYTALREMNGEEYMKDCWLWLYRGAWHEWEMHDIEMAIPISPEELDKKRNAIFYHQSQKDMVMFQGDDTREFWQRAEARNRDTATKYHKLGFSNYEAFEAFKRDRTWEK